MVTLNNGNVVLIGGYGHEHEVTMFDFEKEKWVNLPNVTYLSSR